MNTPTVELLDRLSKHLNNASDYRIAKLVGVTGATVSKWRVGKGSMSDATALRVAELLNENPAYVLAVVQSQRTESDDARKVYRRIAAQFAGKAASILLGLLALVGSGTPTPARAYTPENGSICRSMYIMVSEIASWIRRLLQSGNLRFAIEGSA